MNKLPFHISMPFKPGSRALSARKQTCRPDLALDFLNATNLTANPPRRLHRASCSPFHAVEPAKVQFRSLHRQVLRSARDCRGPARPIVFDVNTLRFRVYLSSVPCQGHVPVHSGSHLRFGRITQAISSLLNSLPLTCRCYWCQPVACMEIPELDMSYYEPYRHSLSTFPSV